MSESRAFWAIYLCVGISYLGVGLVAPLIAIVLAGRGENSLTVGLIGTTTFTAFTLASFPLGALTDRVGPKTILIWGLVVYGLSILTFAFIRSTGLFFLVRAVEGVGAAGISVATETMINWLSAPGERARRMSYYALAVGLGWAAGPLTGALLFKVTPAVPFIACFVFSVVAAALALAIVPKTGSGPHSVKGLLSVFSVQLLAPIAAGGIYGYLMSSLVTLFPLYLTAELKTPGTAMGTIITAVIIGTIASQVPIGKAADKFGKGLVLLISAVLLGVFFIILSMQTDWRGVVPVAGIIGALGGTLYPVGLSIIGGSVPRQRLGSATSLFSLSFGIGSLIGPAASGSAMTADPKWLFYLPALLSWCFALALIGLRRFIGLRHQPETAD